MSEDVPELTDKDFAASWLGGVLVPDVAGPGGAFVPISTDSLGAHTISMTWPAGFPANIQIVVQYWIAGAAGPQGLSASNAITQTAN